MAPDGEPPLSVNATPATARRPSVAKTIAELLAWGYLAQDPRAPPSGGRAVSHYTVRKPSSEDLKAEIDAWVRAQRLGASHRPFPDRKERPASTVGEQPLSVSSSTDDERPLFIWPLTESSHYPSVTESGHYPTELTEMADGECALPTVTSNRTSRDSDGSSASLRSGKQASSHRPDERLDLEPVGLECAPHEAELAVAFYNEEADKHCYRRCTKLTQPLRKRLEARLNDIGGLENFKRAVLAVQRDRFLSGKCSPRPGDDGPIKLSIKVLLQTDGRMTDVLATLLDLAEEGSDHNSFNDAAAQAARDEMEATYRGEVKVRFVQHLDHSAACVETLDDVDTIHHAARCPIPLGDDQHVSTA